MPIPHLFGHHHNDDSHNHAETRVKKILSHVPSSLISQRIGFSKSSSSSSISSTSTSSSSSSTKSSERHKSPSRPTSSTDNKEVLNEDGFQEPKKILFPKARVQEILAWKNGNGAGAGLHNHGNTCFLNSVVQCITYTPPLTNYLLSKEHSRSCKTVGFCMMCILEKHVTRATSAGGAISPSEVVQNLRKIAPGFRPGRQEDAHEFLRFVIENAQKSCLGHLQKDKTITPRDAQTTLIGNIFGGYLQSQVKCSECHYESNTYDPFMDLSVDLGDKVDSLAGALTKFIKPEILDARNMYMCSKCKKRVRAQKRMRIYQAPPILTIQLKRFNFFQMFGGKINKPIKFEARLNLDPYMTKPSPEGTNVYNLYGVLVHLGGSTNSGHYYSFIKAPNGEWYQMDDSSDKNMSIRKEGEVGGNGSLKQSKANVDGTTDILFYAKAPSSARSTTPTRAAPSSVPTTPSSVPSSPSAVPTTPPSVHLNGQRRDSNSKTQSTDPKDNKMNGKSIPMSSIFKIHEPFTTIGTQGYSLIHPEDLQQRSLNQQQDSQAQKVATPSPLPATSLTSPHLKPQQQPPQQPQQPQQQDQPTTQTETLPQPKQAIPRALRLQKATQQKSKSKSQQDALLPSHSSLLSQPQTTPPPQEESAIITSNDYNAKRKHTETPTTPLLATQTTKKRRVEYDTSVVSTGGLWSVRDVDMDTQASLISEKPQKSVKPEKQPKSAVEKRDKSEKYEKLENGEVTEKLVEKPEKAEKGSTDKELTKQERREKKKAAKKAKKEKKAEEKEKEAKEKEKQKDADKWRNLFDQAAHSEDTTKDTTSATNGKHAESGKANGKEATSKKTAASENGKHHAENGKTNGNGNYAENGNHHDENGKMNGNGNHVENGENGKHHAENGKANGKHENGKANGKAENGKSAIRGFGQLKFTVNDGISVSSAKQMATNFLKKMEIVRDSASVLGSTVSTWDDSEEAVQADKTRKAEKAKKEEKIERMFQQRDEWDIEYDLGRQKKVKTYDLFDSTDNQFQYVADQRAIK